MMNRTVVHGPIHMLPRGVFRRFRYRCKVERVDPTRCTSARV